MQLITFAINHNSSSFWRAEFVGVPRLSPRNGPVGVEFFNSYTREFFLAHSGEDVVISVMMWRWADVPSALAMGGPSIHSFLLLFKDDGFCS